MFHKHLRDEARRKQRENAGPPLRENLGAANDGLTRPAAGDIVNCAGATQRGARRAHVCRRGFVLSHGGMRACAWK